MVALTQTIPPSPQAKFPTNTWRWVHRPDRYRWETYRTPIDWPDGLYKWLFDNFGLNKGMSSGGAWDYHGGWIYIYREDYVEWFNLKWS